MMNSAKKLCVVIGVGPGLGMAISSRFGQNDFKVAMVARSQQKLATYQEELENNGVESAIYPADVSDFDSLASALDLILQENGPAEVMVYNVSILNPGVPSALEVDTMVSDFKVNVGGAVVAYQKMVPQMKGNDSACYIITGGGLSTDPYYEFASLGVGKAGVRNLSQSMMQEAEKIGIRVNTLTLKGMIKKDTYFDPDKISEEYWRIYNNPDLKNQEIVYEED